MYGLLYMNVSILENPMLFEKCMSMISEDRKEKINQYKNPAPARLSLGAGTLLRLAMEKCHVSDQLTEIAYGKHGKPYLKGSDFHFSLSHSGEYVVCAYGDESLGADIQRIKDSIPNHTNKILSQAEKSYLDSLNGKDKNNAFYRIWTRKESLIKWDGRGLKISLPEIKTVMGNQLTDMVSFEGKNCYYLDLNFLMPLYTICICSENKIDWDDISEVTSEFLKNLKSF